LLTAGVGAVMLAGLTSQTLAQSAVSGNFNVKMEGYMVITPSGGSAERLDLEGIGQLFVSARGSLSGAENFTSVNSSAASEDLCSGSLAGTINAPTGSFGTSSGDFTIGLSYTPTSSGATCVPTNSTLSCSRALLRTNNETNLAAGEYRCVVANVTAGSGATATVNAASERIQLTSTRGSNSPTN
jgi:hypothetical protein